MNLSSLKHWTFHTEDKIGILCLNRPEKKNRIGEITLLELKLITDYLNDQEDIWVVILKAAGTDFSHGVDINLIGNMIDQESASFRKKLKESQEILDQFEKLSKPTIAVLQGQCVGGGMILALCCDFRIASSDTIISFPEVKRSIGVIMGTQRITRVAGIAATKELVLLGKAIDSEKALSLNLLTTIVSAQELESAAMGMAQKFKTLPPLAVGICKRIINEGIYADRSGQDIEIDAQQEILESYDFKEAISSFFEKRTPIFKGK